MNPALVAELESTIRQVREYMVMLHRHGLPIHHHIWAAAIRENVELALEAAA